MLLKIYIIWFRTPEDNIVREEGNVLDEEAAAKKVEEGNYFASINPYELYFEL